MLAYIIQVILFHIMFFALYELLLRRETFFQWNRVYLISTSLLAYIIPLVKIDRVSEIIPLEYSIILPEIIQLPITMKQELEDPQVDFNYLELVFWSGIILASAIFLIKLYRIFLLINKNEIEHKGKYFLVLLNNSNTFSFFNYIFLEKAISQKSKEQIIKHELIHVKQKHSLDLLFFEFQKIVSWFNPFSYIFQLRISELHEFIADSKAIKDNDKMTYFNNLLAKTFGTEHISFTNPFFKPSLIKKRIIMLNKNRSKRLVKIKYLLTIPLIMVMFIITTNILAQGNETARKKEKAYKLSLVSDSPVYPNCESLNSQFEIRKCLSESITKLFMENYDFTLLKKLDDKTRNIHVFTAFIIDKNGTISSPFVSARFPNQKLEEDEELEKEALRVLDLIPPMKPGILKGRSVGVKYRVSITYTDKELSVTSFPSVY